jgi:hypothetical protein
MAALVLVVGIGSVARFCPQDLRFESGGKHPAKSMPTAAAITTDAKPVEPASAAPVITPTTFTTIGAPATASPTAAPKKKSARRSTATASPSVSGSASAAASAASALPDNPYPQASPPETYGF